MFCFRSEMLLSPQNIWSWRFEPIRDHTGRRHQKVSTEATLHHGRVSRISQLSLDNKPRLIHHSLVTRDKVHSVRVAQYTRAQPAKTSHHDHRPPTDLQCRMSTP